MEQAARCLVEEIERQMAGLLSADYPDHEAIISVRREGESYQSALKSFLDYLQGRCKVNLMNIFLSQAF